MCCLINSYLDIWINGVNYLYVGGMLIMSLVLAATMVWALGRRIKY